MSSVFIIDNTDGTLSLTMPPGFLNGPGSGTRDSDLRLYGMGALLWGEGVNENILRIAENFAVEEKAGSPGIPKDESDLAPGLGITNPLTGQTWYNKTDEQLYYYTGTKWNKTSAVFVNNVQPGDPEDGDLWFDTDNGNPCTNSQLKIYDGSSWLSVADDYLSECGGSVTGNINMTGNSILNLSYPTNATDAVNMQYVMDREASILNVITTHENRNDLHLTAAQNTILDTMVSNIPGGVGNAELGEDLSRMGNFNDAFAGSTVAVEMGNRIRKNATDTMTSGQTIVLGRDPNASTMEATTASWVQTQIDVATGGNRGERSVRYWNSKSGSALDGDIHIDTSGRAWMRISSAWKQIFPAQYS